MISIERLRLDARKVNALSLQATSGLEHRLDLHGTKHTARQEGADPWPRVLDHVGLHATVAVLRYCGFCYRCRTAPLAGHRSRHPVEAILDRSLSAEA